MVPTLITFFSVNVQLEHFLGNTEPLDPDFGSADRGGSCVVRPTAYDP